MRVPKPPPEVFYSSIGRELFGDPDDDYFEKPPTAEMRKTDVIREALRSLYDRCGQLSMELRDMELKSAEAEAAWQQNRGSVAMVGQCKRREESLRNDLAAAREKIAALESGYQDALRERFAISQ